MSAIEFEFDMEKTVEVILYIANRISNPTIRDVAKLIYFVDKTSLEKYGRFVTGDNYVAMQQGPVPSKTYDLLKAGRDADSYGFAVENKYHIKTLRDANPDELSESDVACLDQVIDVFGNYPGWLLVQLSHDDAYNKVWSQGQSNNAPIPVKHIAHGFDDSDELIDYLENLNND
jgi:uncharacterized phage-associated protein